LRAPISALAALFVLGVTASPALAQTYTLTLSGPTTATVGKSAIMQASGSNPPEDFFSSWLDVSAIPTSVLATCPDDYLAASQVARSASSDGGDVVVTAQRENVDAAGNFSLPFGYTPTKAGRFLLCGYTNDGATYTLARASMTVDVSGGSTGVAKPANVTKPKLTRSGGQLVCSRGRWSNRPSRFSYSWFVDGKRKKGATGRRLAITRNLRNHAVLCKVTASNAGGSKTAASRALRL
jgi:hypothetical protein